jgi:hypothetical protein
MNLKESVLSFANHNTDYYNQWILDKPLIVSRKHHQDMLRLQNIMERLIVHFVNNYDQYSLLMPVSSEVQEILNFCSQRPYTPGTYRTDFVYDENQQVRIIEITSRFAMNGIFLAAVINKIAEDYRAEHFPLLKTLDAYGPIYKHLECYLNTTKSVYILTGSDRRNESKIYKEIIERTGREVLEIHFSEIEKKIDELTSSWIISELGFDEILSIPKHVMKRLAALNVTNDFRTIFLTHDKRFFHVLNNIEFQQDILSTEEIDFFADFLIPTYSHSSENPLWEEAKHNKNEWIIKHRSLGKSQKVYAGIVTSEDEWLSLFNTNMEDLVLQRWVKQTTIEGTIGTEEFNDFITGTLLFFDNQYFGFGDFRTSSHPVTNVKDHRKASSLILESDENLNQFSSYNFIP